MSGPQRRNAELVDLLRSDFPHWNIYDQDAYARALQFALMQPGLVGAWGGVLDRSTPALVDISGNGQHLTFNGDAHIGQDANLPFVPYIALDGTGDYLSRADEAKLDILGTETTVASALRGLTFSAWVRFTNTAAATEVIGSKQTSAGNQRSWALFRNSSGFLGAVISNAGVATEASATGATVLTSVTWRHLAVVFDPSTAVTVYVNGAQDGIDNTSVPTSLFNSSAALQIGASDAGTQLLTGRIALPRLAASVISADLIFYYYQMTRHLFGV